MQIAAIMIIIGALLAVLYGVISIHSILKLPRGNERMKEIASAIQVGAKAFLNRQYRTVGVVAILLFIIIGLVPSLGWTTALAFIVGAILSAVAIAF